MSNVVPTAAKRERVKRQPGEVIVRCTKREQSERIDAVRNMLAKALRKSEIKRLCRDKWNVSASAVERYIRAARKRNLADVGGDAQELVSNAYQTYLEVIRRGFMNSPVDGMVVSPSDIIAARRAADKLLGLDAAVKIDVKDERSAVDAKRRVFDLLRELSRSAEPGGCAAVTGTGAVVDGDGEGRGIAVLPTPADSEATPVP